MLYVSKHENEWKDDVALLENNETYAYVENIEDSFCSEIGLIGFKIINGGLQRTY